MILIIFLIGETFRKNYTLRLPIELFLACYYLFVVFYFDLNKMFTRTGSSIFEIKPSKIWKIYLRSTTGADLGGGEYYALSTWIRPPVDPKRPPCTNLGYLLSADEP